MGKSFFNRRKGNNSEKSIVSEDEDLQLNNPVEKKITKYKQSTSGEVEATDALIDKILEEINQSKNENGEIMLAKRQRKKSKGKGKGKKGEIMLTEAQRGSLRAILNKFTPTDDNEYMVKATRLLAGNPSCIAGIYIAIKDSDTNDKQILQTIQSYIDDAAKRTQNDKTINKVNNGKQEGGKTPLNNSQQTYLRAILNKFTPTNNSRREEVARLLADNPSCISGIYFEISNRKITDDEKILQTIHSHIDDATKHAQNDKTINKVNNGKQEGGKTPLNNSQQTYLRAILNKFTSTDDSKREEVARLLADNPSCISGIYFEISNSKIKNDEQILATIEGYIKRQKNRQNTYLQNKQEQQEDLQPQDQLEEENNQDQFEEEEIYCSQSYSRPPLCPRLTFNNLGRRAKPFDQDENEDQFEQEGQNFNQEDLQVEQPRSLILIKQQNKQAEITNKQQRKQKAVLHNQYLSQKQYINQQQYPDQEQEQNANQRSSTLRNLTRPNYKEDVERNRSRNNSKMHYK
ncbi:hypothetical protein [Candidatus Deianiraea vastatrix]|uniref:Uncharacterized protein n=1 Tax=Candidatus Deianiraea vastatrix TaxID=2163644 RepID=A0A5B8XHY3_9RICK|nr:hypothetical protein [Candidatus Deianiraea vastatrix]QED23654.1 hypothetical protein Deia_00867 [Candidatus Deianiraea vastatrix]